MNSIAARARFHWPVFELGKPPIASDDCKMIDGKATIGGVVHHIAVKVRKLDVVLLTMFKRKARSL